MSGHGHKSWQTQTAVDPNKGFMNSIREVICQACRRRVDESESRWNLVYDQRGCPYCRIRYTEAQLEAVGFEPLTSKQQKTKAGGHGPDPRTAAKIEACRVLGVKISATRDEVKVAYRCLVAQYHPDKVAQLGPELRDLAKTKTQQLNRAYAALAK